MERRDSLRLFLLLKRRSKRSQRLPDSLRMKGSKIGNSDESDINENID
jgi:hypothetical protein